MRSAHRDHRPDRQHGLAQPIIELCASFSASGRFDPDLDCSEATRRFIAFAAQSGIQARERVLVPGAGADPLQGHHHVAVIEPYAAGGEGLVAVDWTARQFAALQGAPEEPIPEPLLWTPPAGTTVAASYPLPWVEFVAAPYVVVPCSGRKAHGALLPARERYTGTLHRLAMAAARTITVEDRILILSARYGLLHLEDLTEPYDQALQTLPREELQATAARDHAAACGLHWADPDASVVALVPNSYQRVLDQSPLLARKLISPLMGCRGIGEMRGRLSRLRDGFDQVPLAS